MNCSVGLLNILKLVYNEVNMTSVLYLFSSFENIRHSTFILLIVNISIVAADALKKFFFIVVI